MKWLGKRLKEATSWNAIGGAALSIGTMIGSGMTVGASIAAFALGFIIKENSTPKSESEQ